MHSSGSAASHEGQIHNSNVDPHAGPKDRVARKRGPSMFLGEPNTKRPKGAHGLESDSTRTSAGIRANPSSVAPLPERLRPQLLADFIGQPHIVGPNSLLMNLVRSGAIGSMILWGPPG
jgi:hypothetical protein